MSKKSKFKVQYNASDDELYDDEDSMPNRHNDGNMELTNNLYLQESGYWEQFTKMKSEGVVFIILRKSFSVFSV